MNEVIPICCTIFTRRGHKSNIMILEHEGAHFLWNWGPSGLLGLDLRQTCGHIAGCWASCRICPYLMERLGLGAPGATPTGSIACNVSWVLEIVFNQINTLKDGTNWWGVYIARLLAWRQTTWLEPKDKPRVHIPHLLRSYVGSSCTLVIINSWYFVLGVVNNWKPFGAQRIPNDAVYKWQGCADMMEVEIEPIIPRGCHNKRDEEQWTGFLPHHYLSSLAGHRTVQLSPSSICHFASCDVIDGR